MIRNSNTVFFNIMVIFDKTQKVNNAQDILISNKLLKKIKDKNIFQIHLKTSATILFTCLLMHLKN